MGGVPSLLRDKIVVGGGKTWDRGSRVGS
jgi:hypothetical protein